MPVCGITPAELTLTLKVTSAAVALALRSVVVAAGAMTTAMGEERTEYQFGSPTRVAVSWWVPVARSAVVKADFPLMRSAEPMRVPLSKNWTGPAGPETPAGAAGLTCALSVRSAPKGEVAAEEARETVGVMRSTGCPTATMAEQ